MSDTPETPSVSEKASLSGYVPLLFERFRERSYGAYAPQEIPMVREWRQQDWPRESGYSLDQQQERNAYHQARRDTRGHEALTPGEDTRIPMLTVMTGKRTGTRKGKFKDYTQRVYDPEAGECVYTEPTRFAPGQFSISPRFLASTSLSSSEVAVLRSLWDLRDPYEWKVNVRAVVKGWTQEAIGKGAGDLSYSYVSEITSSLEEKGFLAKYPDGYQGKCVYKLAACEHGHWTYATLDRRSARARIQRLLDKGPEELDWSLVGEIDMWKQRRLQHYEKKDEAQKKLEADRKRSQAREQQHSRDKGQPTSAALASILQSYKNESGRFWSSAIDTDKFHEDWKRGRNGPAPPED